MTDQQTFPALTREKIEQASPNHFGRVEIHYGQCSKTVGPRGGVTIRQEVWRTNGQLRTWKRDRERFEQPIKYGLRGYSTIDQHNIGQFHLASECPLDAS